MEADEPEPAAQPAAEAAAAESEPAMEADEPGPAAEPAAEAVEPAREPETGPASVDRAAPAAEETPPGTQPEPAPINFDPERYTVAIEEPDWWVEDEPAEPSSPADELAEEAVATEARAEEPVAAEGRVEEPTEEPTEEPPAATMLATPEPLMEAVRPVEEVSDERDPVAPEPARSVAEAPALEEAPAAAEPETATNAQEAIAAQDRREETMLWLGSGPGATAADSGDGADEMEVVGGSSGRPSHADLPGSRELHEALAALDAIAGRTPPAAATEPEAPPASVAPAPPPAPSPEPEPAERPAWPTVDRPASSSPPPWRVASSSLTDTGAQRPSSTPASRAYRRLRRIFPG